MSDPTCRRCGAKFRVAEPDRVRPCPECGVPLLPALDDHLAAAEGMREKVASTLRISDGLRARLLAEIDAEIGALREQAEEIAGAPAREAPLPPPLPPPAPSHPEPAGSAAAPAGSPAPPATPAEPSGPSVWTRLGPVFAENLLFSLAAFLLVAGAVYFVTTAWTTMSGSQRRLVVIGGLELLGGVLFAASRVVNRDGTLPQAERLLLTVVAFLVPTAAAPAGELLLATPRLGLAAAALVLGPGFFAVRAFARREDPALSPGLPIAAVAAAILVLLGPRAAAAPVTAATAVGLFLLAVVSLADRRVLPALSPRNTPVVKAGLLLAFSALVVAAVASLAAIGAGRPAGTALAVYGVITAGIGLATVLAELRLAREDRLPTGRSVPALLAGMAAGVAGAAVAAGDDRALLAAAGFGALACLAAGLRLPGGLLLLPGLVLSAIAYLHLPAPIREVALRARDTAARGLGYAPRRLPISFYGVTFVPFVAATGILAGILRRRGRPAHARIALGWTLLSAAGLSALALFAGADLRAPAAVLTAQGALLVALSLLVGGYAVAFIGCLGLFAGLHCALAYPGLPSGLHVLALILAGAGAIALARRVAGRRPALAAAIVDAVAATGAAAAVVLGIGLIRHVGTGVPPAGSSLLDLAGYPALALLLTVLAVVYRRPAWLALAAVPLVAAADSLVGAWNAPISWFPPLFAGAAGLQVAAAVGAERIRAALPARRPAGGAETFRILPWLVGAYALLAGACFTAGVRGGGSGLGPVVGFLALAAVLTAVVRIARRPSAAAALPPLLVAAGVAAAGAVTGRLTWGPGLLGSAGGLAAAALAAGLASRRESDSAPAQSGSISPLSGLLLLLLLLRLLSPDYRASPVEAVLLAGAALLLAAVVRLGLPRLHFTGLGLAVPLFAGTGAASVALVFVGVLDAFTAPLGLYPLGLLLAAAATAVAAISRPGAKAPVPVFGQMAVVHLAIALVLAVLAAGVPSTNGSLLLLAFAGVVEGGRLAARPYPRTGGLVLLLAGLGGLSLALGHLVLHLPAFWQPVLCLAFGAGALLALRLPSPTIHPTAVAIVTIPILSLAAAGLQLFLVVVILASPSTRSFTSPQLVSLALDAGLFCFASLLLAPRYPRLLRFGLTWGSAALATFLFPVVNVAIHGWTRFFRPDVEIAGLAVLLAVLGPPADPTARPRWSRRATEIGTYLLATSGILLTAGEIGDVTTPLAVLLAAVAPLALYLRRAGDAHLEAHGYGLVLAALTFTLFAVPKTGRPAPEILPLFAAVTTLTVLLFRTLGSRVEELGRHRARVARVSGAAGALALLFVGANAVLLRDLPADATAVVLCAFTLAVLGGGALREIVRGAGGGTVQFAMAAGGAGYAFFALRTPFLDPLRGHHLLVLAAVGLALVLAVERLPERLRAAVRRDGLLLPGPAAAVALVVLLGSPPPPGPEPLALFLAAAVYGIVAARERSPGLGVLSAVLVNLALYAIWIENSIVDPAFFGVPPGLTLLAGAELLGARLRTRTRLGLFVAGAALLYGSVGMQVLRVEEPVHALVLFGLGIATVLVGLSARRNETMTTGAVVVVLDVLAYLVRHGFEESFLAAGLLVLAGLTVFAVAILSTRNRRR